MESPIKNLDELLNGMLDSTLSEAESVDIHREMARDPSLKRRLDELAAIRRALLGGRSTKSLGPDFAGSVSLAAKKRASEMETNPPKWLVRTKTVEQLQRSLFPRVLDSVPSRRWIYAGLSLAASLLLAILVIPKAERQAMVSVPSNENIASNDASKIPSDPTGSLEAIAASDLTSADPATANPATANSVAFSPVRVSNAVPKKESVASTPLAEDKVHKMDVNEDGAFNAWDPLAVLANINQQANDARASRQGNTVGLPQELNDKSVPKQKLYFTVVLDVSIDPQAVENRTLERILEKYDIVSTDDLIVNDEQLKQLEESKLVGNIANTEEKMGVMFLRSTAKKLDLAMVDIINRFEDFPEFAMDVTTDQSALLLVNQLGSIRVAEGTSDTASRLLLEKAPGRSSPFATSARRGKPMDNASRQKFKGGGVPPNPVRDEISYALLLLRPAKK